MNSNKTTTLIIGGSLGAKSINEAIKRNTAYLNEYDDVQYIWQCGKLYHSGLFDTDSAKLPNVTMLPFIERMDYAYAIADIVIARSGALTVSELANLSKSSILIPSPNVAEDHQTKNAMALVNAGAALMIKDAEVDKWTKVHRELVESETKRDSLKKCIKSFAKPKAADKIADMVLAIAKGD
jgi:UDP-N-acetylglucosamine--N-acetylmuramyl-(pentapeptide) pyrophosphoryl-undecaprenol N-acetylglucosamine transferase